MTVDNGSLPTRARDGVGVERPRSGRESTESTDITVTPADDPMLEDEGGYMFDAGRIRTSDIDGSGTTDLIYLGPKTEPDGIETTFGYDVGGKLITVDTDGNDVATDVVTSIKYNSKSQRLSIAYGNGTTTTYMYDPLTFRLATLVTAKSGPVKLQDLTYTYDPVGNNGGAPLILVPENLDATFNGLGNLTCVQYYWESQDNGHERLVAISLRFLKRTVFLGASGDSDELTVLDAEPSVGERGDASGIPPWVHAVHLQISTCWMLLNARGYSDGIQFEFGRTNGPSVQIRTLVR